MFKLEHYSTPKASIFVYHGVRLKRRPKVMNESKPCVYIVDDDEAVRDSLTLILDSINQACKAYDSAQSFIQDYSPQMCGCLVLDIRMPRMTGLELQKRLNDINCDLPIIFVTGHGDVPMAVEAMQKGAADFVQKPYREQELIDKINTAMNQHVTLREQNQEVNAIRHKIQSLTSREREVMDMMVEGKANKVIAIDLGISQRTVEIHRARVMEKMATHSLAQLVKMNIAALEN